jgi:hypothetical protein
MKLFPPMRAIAYGPNVIADTWTSGISIVGSTRNSIIARRERLYADAAEMGMGEISVISGHRPDCFNQFKARLRG